MMKALRLEKPGHVELVDVPVPTIRDDELLIRTGATTICTSDLADIRENPFGTKLPAVIGHEGAGVIAQVGAAVTGFRVGDRAACHPVHPCRECPTCRRGLGHLCPNMTHFGISLPGTFAEYFICRQDRARKIPAEMPFEMAALAEPVCVCLEALERAGKAERLLIIGDGPFGVLMARLAGKATIAGRHDYRLAFAGKAEKTMQPTGEFDAVILAVGSPEAVAQGIELLAPRGRLVLFAAPTGLTPTDLFRVHMKELEIVGACNDPELFDRAVELLPVTEGLVTHRFALEDYREALAMGPSAMKVAFTFEGVGA